MSSEHRGRIGELADRARADREGFDPPADPPDEESALYFLREGVGPAVWVYVEGRTGGRMTPFSPVEFSLLERAMNDWLELYAACYGVEMEASFTVREVAKALIDTRNIRDAAELVTGVPERG